MGMGLSVVSEGHFDSLRINHPTPCTIVQPVAGGDVLWYVVYRFLMAIYIVGSFVNCIVATHNDMKDNFAFLHFPVWGYIAANIQAVLLAICTLANYQYVYKTMSDPAPKHRRSTRRSHRGKKTTFSVSVPKMPQAYVIIWVTYYIMLYSSLMTLLMYETGLFREEITQRNSERTSYLHFPIWGYFAGTLQSILMAYSTLENYYAAYKAMSGRLLFVTPYRPNHRRTITQIVLHQAFFGYCLLDFFLCGIPVRLLHFYVMTTYAIVYQLVLLITTLILKMNAEKYRPIYNVADVDGHRLILCCSYFVGFSFITPVALHIIYYCLFLLKSHLIELYFRTTRVTTKKPSQKAEDATGEHDGYGAEKAAEWTPGAPRTSKIMPISEQEEAEINSPNKEQSPSNNSIALVDFK